MQLKNKIRNLISNFRPFAQKEVEPIVENTNSLYSDLKFIAQHLIFENVDELRGKMIKIDRTSKRLESDIHFVVNQMSNFETSLENTGHHKLAIKNMAFLI